MALACPSGADGGCIGTLELQSLILGGDTDFKPAHYDLLAGSKRKVKVKLKGSEGAGRRKMLAVAAGLEPGDEIIGESRVITVVGG